MTSKLRQHWLFLLLWILVSAFYLAGTSSVPFHPDESTFLFMSAEFDRALSDPAGLAWDHSADLTPVMRYRMIDAPLTRYLVGFGLSLASIEPPSVDWDWSESWEANQASGALPNPLTLQAGRLVVASLFPLSLLLLYLIGLKLNGRLLGITMLIIFSFNPLVLLHTRRVMAEGVLIFTLLLALYALLYAPRYPFLAGLAVSLAVNAKHSAMLLLPAALLAVTWIAVPGEQKVRSLSARLAAFVIGFGMLVFLLNPFLWREPVAAAEQASALRQNLLERQVADYSHIAPAQVLDSYSRRTAVAIAQLYLAPPVFSETGNYLPYTRVAEQAYLDSLGVVLGRTPVVSGLMIALTLLGLIAVTRNVVREQGAIRSQGAILLVAVAGFLLGTLLFIPLAWQRYYLPLVIFMVIFSGMGFVWGIKTSRALLTSGRLSQRLSQILAQFAADSWMP